MLLAVAGKNSRATTLFNFGNCTREPSNSPFYESAARMREASILVIIGTKSSNPNGCS